MWMKPAGRCRADAEVADLGRPAMTYCVGILVRGGLVMILLGGQIGDTRMRLFQVYSAGNFIEATLDTPYLQIGEHKYGKPILDRSISFDVDVLDALKLGLISMDSTLRSNLSVGLPVDLHVSRNGALKSALNFRIQPEEPYFHDLRERWSKAL